MKLSEIARRLGCQLDGDGEIEITGVAGIEEAHPGQLTFLANRKYAPAVKTTRASAIVIAKDAGPLPLAALRSDNPYLDFARAIELFYQSPQYSPGIHPAAVVSAKAKIGEGAHIGPYCFVDDEVEIGRHAVLHSFVSIYRGVRIGDNFFAHSHSVVREFCRLGNRVILQNGVVVGADGFGFAKQADGRWHKMRQSGITVVEDDVEIQAGSCVDRATIGETRIRRGAKLDNFVQVGHASTVGEDTLLCGQVGLAGSTVVGNRCILAGQVGAAGHLEIGDGAVLTARSAVHNDVPAGQVVSGSPGMDNKLWLKCTVAFNHLPELVKTVRELKSELEKLRKRS
ncbi:MAG: UDP-3-O-(3-hydroxymyristoyl)glucosamine N-acyltransferase [Acidobacteria bacterium]|nr:UDP-3-O-(3-hydroxymyristoyl)glucosamine N-acyltransferase [Acidobacteriota bacterium]MBI3663207.1 UDP-3-O-(3-hydroxymyristoyl)glucosamine N-acyltransferase [Acidobacteriota bacterium]